MSALKAYEAVRAEMQRSAVDAVERLHANLHINRWQRDNPETVLGSRPQISELCINKVDCIQLSQAVNRVKHALARVEV